MKHFTDALFEEIEENPIASLAELKILLPEYATTVDQALRHAKNIEYDAKPKLESSSYILPNGALINGPWEGHPAIQEVALESLPEQIRNKVYNEDDEYEDYMDQMIENEASLLDCVYKNVIRLNSASDNTYIGIDTSQQPLTRQQLDTLEAWLDLVLYSNSEVDVTIWDSNTNQRYFRGTLTLDNYDSRDVINLIRYIQTNKRPPSTAVWEAIEPKQGSRNKYFASSLFEDINSYGETHQALLKAWGGSTPGNGCIFITPEGTYLNLFPKIFSHDKLCDWVDRSGYDPTNKQAKWFSDNLDYVRCRNTHGLCLIELPAKITASQLDALQVWLETKVSDNTLDVGTADGQYKSYNLQDMLPEDIIKRIKRYYSSGKLYEHKPAKSKS